jgi:trk system potassium uptake protein TrkA
VKRIIVVGLGNFGSTLAHRLHELGHEVVAIDIRPDLVDAIGPRVSRAFAGDATKRAVLEEVGAAEAGAAAISTGDDLAASVLTLLTLHDLGLKQVFVKVISEAHARIVDALGAEEAVFPERESALGLASRMTASGLLRYTQLAPGVSAQEMAVPDAWCGKTLRELELPQRYRVQVVALHDLLRDTMQPIPAPDRVLTQSDTLLLAGEPQALDRLTRLR